MKIALISINELDPDHGVKGLEVDNQGQMTPVFVIRVDQEVYAYLNHCPHTGVELNWLPDQFLDLDRSFIQCATHDARFQIDDGVCVAGPCVGDRLTALPISIEEDIVYWDE